MGYNVCVMKQTKFAAGDKMQPHCESHLLGSGNEIPFCLSADVDFACDAIENDLDDLDFEIMELGYPDDAEVSGAGWSHLDGLSIPLHSSTASPEPVQLWRLCLSIPASPFIPRYLKSLPSPSQNNFSRLPTSSSANPPIQELIDHTETQTDFPDTTNQALDIDNENAETASIHPFPQPSLRIQDERNNRQPAPPKPRRSPTSPSPCDPPPLTPDPISPLETYQLFSSSEALIQELYTCFKAFELNTHAADHGSSHSTLFAFRGEWRAHIRPGASAPCLAATMKAVIAAQCGLRFHAGLPPPPITGGVLVRSVCAHAIKWRRAGDQAVEAYAKAACGILDVAVNADRNGEYRTAVELRFLG
ncbi:hypothetical protein DFH09DRAFT_1174005 [Mycena vulgaris]|nr:hypothetical protein DFH09DRAFT_1174005 [Mycena vulgaris]